MAMKLSSPTTPAAAAESEPLLATHAPAEQVPGNSSSVGDEPAATTPKPTRDISIPSHRPTLIIPSQSEGLGCRFPYPSALAWQNISPESWRLFNIDLKQAIKLSPREWAIAVATGGGVCLSFTAYGLLSGPIGGALLLGHGLISGSLVVYCAVAGFEDSKVRHSLQEGGQLDELVRSWNESYFSHRGVTVEVLYGEHKQQGHGKDGKEEVAEAGAGTVVFPDTLKEDWFSRRRVVRKGKLRWKIEKVRPRPGVPNRWSMELAESTLRIVVKFVNEPTAVDVTSDMAAAMIEDGRQMQRQPKTPMMAG